MTDPDADIVSLHMLAQDVRRFVADHGHEFRNYQIQLRQTAEIIDMVAARIGRRLEAA